MKKGAFFLAFVIAMTVFAATAFSQLAVDQENYVVVGKGIKYPDGTVQTTAECCNGSGAAVYRTGQTTSYGTRDDGQLQTGAAWPVPRFTDNEDGTVTDNLTNLVWLQDAQCFGIRTWTEALSDCNSLSNDQCGLSDGSAAGDWHLPNKNELLSLIHAGFSGPAIPDTAGSGQWSEDDPFSGVESSYYWTSTTAAWDINGAWDVHLNQGQTSGYSKAQSHAYAWPVRTQLELQ